MADSSLALSTFLGIAPKSSEGAVLRLLIELGAQVVGAEEGSLLVLDESTNELVFAMTVSGAAGSTAAAGGTVDDGSESALIGQRVPLGKGITGLAALTQEVQIGAATFKDVKQSERHTARAAEPTAVLAAPMLVADTLVGVITAVSFRSEVSFTSEHAALYGRIAAVAGVVVEQRRRIAGMEAISQGGQLTAAQAREQRVIESVSRLSSGGDPARMEKVATLLAAIEALAAR